GPGGGSVGRPGAGAIQARVVLRPRRRRRRLLRGDVRRDVISSGLVRVGSVSGPRVWTRPVQRQRRLHQWRPWQQVQTSKRDVVETGHLHRGHPEREARERLRLVRRPRKVRSGEVRGDIRQAREDGPRRPDLGRDRPAAPSEQRARGLQRL
ncbi:hypothetical protein ACJX0J_021353, partial [Zea mays]